MRVKTMRPRNILVAFVSFLSLFCYPGCSKHRHSRRSSAVGFGKERPCPTSTPELPILSMPGEFCIAEGGKTLLVAQPILGRVIEVSFDDNSARVVTTTPETPWGITRIPGTEEYIVTDTGKGNLLRIDLVRGRERTIQVPVKGTPFSSEVTPDGRTCCVLYAEGFITDVPLYGGDVRIIDPKLNDPWGLALEKDGKTALTCERGTNKLLRIDLSSGDVYEVAQIPRKATDLSLAYGGNFVYLTFENGEVMVINKNTGNSAKIAKVPYAASVSEGTKIAEILVGDFNNGKIYGVDVIEGKATIALEGLGEPTWLSMVDRLTLLVVDQTELGGLYRIDFAPNAARPVLLFENGSDILSAAYNGATGDAYLSIEGGEVYRIPLEAPGKTKVIASNLLNPSGLCVSLDKKRLYLSLYDKDNGYYYLGNLDTDTGKIKALGDHLRSDEYAHFA